jgi:thiamine biosynthesis lipoprotein
MLLLGIAGYAPSQELLARKRVLKLMGTRFEFTAVATDNKLADDGIDAGIEEVRRIEKLISSWDENSQTSEINRNAGIRPVKVDEELYSLVARSLRISDLTNGAFDISFASVGKLWKFDGSMQEPPTRETIAASVTKINYKNIILNPQDTSVFLKEKGMSIGFGGIGKGYAAEQAKVVMIAFGIKSGVVSAAGDLTTWGAREDGKEWDVAIAKPDKSRQILAWLKADNTSVVTSGNYEKFFVYEGKRYSHIIDPRTGYPTTGLKSATIICSNAELADALATTMFVMGKTEGLALINQLNGIECLLITDDDELISSNNLNISYQVALQDTENAHN